MKLDELRKYTPATPPPSKYRSTFAGLIKAITFAGIAAAGYGVYAGKIDVSGLNLESISFPGLNSSHRPTPPPAKPAGGMEYIPVIINIPKTGQ